MKLSGPDPEDRHAAIPVAVALVVLALIFGCTQRPAEIMLPLVPPEGFSAGGTDQLPDRWWTAFKDPQVDALVDQALRANFTLESVWYRLREAQAVVDRQTATLLPDLEGSASAEVSQPEPERGERLRLGLTSSYEVDLWGRIQSAVEAERFRAQATLADYQTAALSLSAEVVRTWYQLTEARNQVDLLNQQIAANDKVLRLLVSRFGSGQTRSVDVIRQRQLVAATSEQKIAAEARALVLEHQLAVLLGNPPRTPLPATVRALPDLPPLPDPGLPAELVRRRPDLQRAFHLLQAADRDVAAAISNQYPRVTLTAAIATEADLVDNLFADWARSLTGGILAPLIDHGARKADVDRTEALKNQRLYEYGQAMLTAFREVEDALVQEQKQLERIASLQEQLDLAGRAYERLRLEYFNGIGNYIDVLTALIEEQRLRRSYLTARLALVESRVALYRALAGGTEDRGQRTEDRVP